MSVPRSIRPLMSSVTCAWIGTRDAPTLGEQSLEAGHGGLDLEDVLRGLDKEHVDAALDEVFRLDVVILFEMRERRVGEHRIAAREEQRRSVQLTPRRSVGWSRRREFVGRSQGRGQRPRRSARCVFSSIPHSRNRCGVDWNVQVSTTSHPSARNDSWIAWMMSGRVNTR